MGELKLIEHFTAGAPTHPWMKVGPGHDCAVLGWDGARDLAYKIDQIVEGTHFVLDGPGAATGREIGWKAMAKACSDIAATGFWPVATTVAVNMRKGTSEQLALELYQGLCDCCRRFGIALAGGDYATSQNGLSVVVSLLGEGPKDGAWTRGGAVPGDVLLVTGTLGGSLGTRRHLTFTPRLDESRRIRELAGNGVHACIDITDGLGRDLHHICKASRCGAVICEAAVPLGSAPPDSQRVVSLDGALTDGEDFELLLAVEAHAAKRLLQNWNMDTPLTQIGYISEVADGCRLQSGAGALRPLPNVGFEHLT